MSELKDAILSEYKNGNIVIATDEGLQSTSLKKIIQQPIDGLLYDLNRNEMVILAFIEDPKWMNDYALVKVLREFVNQNIEKDKEIAYLKEKLNK
jgi:hypothetical protein